MKLKTPDGVEFDINDYVVEFVDRVAAEGAKERFVIAAFVAGAFTRLAPGVMEYVTSGLTVALVDALKKEGLIRDESEKN